MPNEDVKIRLIALDKTKGAFRSVSGNVGKLEKQIFSLRSAFLTLGAGVALRGLMRTGREIERIKVQMNILFKSADKGAKAFEGLSKYASDVPFGLDEIARSAPILATLTDDTEELNKLLEYTGDISAATGLSFEDTAQQLQRVWSGGIASADLFREKGVRAMLGSEAGVQYSADESRKHIDEAFVNGTTVVKGAASDLANTMDGVLSMMGDKFFQFQNVMLNESDLFLFVKEGVKAMDASLGDSEDAWRDLAISAGDSMVDIVKAVLIGSASIYDVIAGPLDYITGGLKSMWDMFKELPTWVQSAGVVGAFLLGKKGVLAIGVAAALVDKLGNALESVIPLGKLEWDTEDSVSLPELILPELIVPANTGGAAGEARKRVEALIATLEAGIEKQRSLRDKQREEDKAADRQKTTEGLSEAQKRIQALLSKQEKADRDAREKVVANLITEEDEYKDSLQRKKEILDEYLTKEAITKEHHATAMANIEKAAQKDSKAQLMDGFNALAQHNQKLFRIMKKVNIANAIMDTYAGANKALASYPPPWSFIAAAGQIAAGLANVASIKAQSFRRFGGSVNAGEPVTVGEQGQETFVPHASGRIEPNGNGGKTINFNITTVDATGFDELLQSRRGMIVNMVNRAMNDRGMVGVTA